MIHPTWIDVWRDMEIARSQFAEAGEKLASLSAAGEVPPGFRADREGMVGLLLHNGYGAVEQALERLISAYDGGLPQGANYHRDLLKRAARDVQGQRPAMIAERTYKLLDDLRRYRHAFRHVYEKYDFTLAAPNVALAAELMPLLEKDLRAFEAATT